jgi:hypothetical protein
MNSLSVDVINLLSDIGVLPLTNHAAFDLPHGDKSVQDTVKQKIKTHVDKKKGIYVYFKTKGEKQKCLYVGKAASLYGRILCHYQESIFEPHGDVLGIMGDAKRGVYPAFFRDKYPGSVNVCWIEVTDELDRQIIESALDKYLDPEFINFKKEFLKTRKTPG